MASDYQPDPELYPGDTLFVDATLSLLPPEQDPYGGVRYGRPGGTPPPMGPLGRPVAPGGNSVVDTDSTLIQFTDGPINPPPAGR